jgi:hypothetical protein
LLFAMVSFMNAWMLGSFQQTRIFVIAFLIDFTIRLFVSPRYAPSLILGRFAVRNQLPEYVGAPQKRFVWAIGFALALAMLFLIVINKLIGPINLLVCAACLTLMFFDSAFGICLGCKVYNALHKEQAQLCPGGSCELPVRQEIQKNRHGANPGRHRLPGNGCFRWPSPAGSGRCADAAEHACRGQYRQR